MGLPRSHFILWSGITISVPTGTNATDRYNVNLPVTSPAGRLAFALLGSDYIVDLELSAAQAEGRGEIKSSPHVITARATTGSITIEPSR